MRVQTAFIVLAAALLSAGCIAQTGTSRPEVPVEAPAAEAQLLVSLGQLAQAVVVPGDDAMVLLEREGRIHLLAGGDPQVVLDISDRVDTLGERGLASLAFHPDFEENGILFMGYARTTDQEKREGFSEVTRYRVDPDDLSSDWERQDVILRFKWTNWFHNMGDLKFGPHGMLYVSLGDGGRHREDAQDISVLNGSVLRINVDGPAGYTVPSDNPFVDEAGARPEIWLYGLRNAWRIDFNFDTGDLYIAASGESTVEAVHHFPADGDAPRNHGWPHMEGDQLFEDYGPPPGEVNLPIVAYERPPDSGMCAVIGGAVYEGEAFPDLQGKFVFGDHCAGKLMFAQEAAGEWMLTQWTALQGEYFTSVDVDADGEIVVSSLGGRLHKIVPA